MLRLITALGLFFGLVVGATAGTWNGNVPARDVQLPIERVGCNSNDFYCSYGSQRRCRPDGYCWCAACNRYYYQPAPQPYVYPQRNYNFGCPPHYSRQDGVCKPYTGR